MSNQTKYLLTVDSKTGAAMKLERVGEAGELTEVPLSTLAAAHAQPVAAMAAQPAAMPVVLNLYLGGYPGGAPLSLVPTQAGWGMVPYGYGHGYAPMMPPMMPPMTPPMMPPMMMPQPAAYGPAMTLAAPGGGPAMSFAGPGPTSTLAGPGPGVPAMAFTGPGPASTLAGPGGAPQRTESSEPIGPGVGSGSE